MQNDGQSHLDLLDTADEEHRKVLVLLLEKRRRLRESSPAHPADAPALKLHAAPSPKRHVKTPATNKPAQADKRGGTVVEVEIGTADVSVPAPANAAFHAADGDQGIVGAGDPVPEDVLSEAIFKSTMTVTSGNQDASGCDEAQLTHVATVREADTNPQRTNDVVHGVSASKRSYALVVVTYTFRHLPSLSEKTKEVAAALFNALVDPSFNRFVSRGSRLLVNPSVIEFQDTVKELQGICEHESSFFFCLSVRLTPERIERRARSSSQLCLRCTIAPCCSLMALESLLVRTLDRTCFSTKHVCLRKTNCYSQPSMRTSWRD